MKKWIVLLGIVLIDCGPVFATGFSWQSVMQFLFTQKNELNAWATNTQQTNVTTKQIISNKISVKQQLAQAFETIRITDDVVKVHLSFADKVGQPASIGCNAQMEGKLFVEAVAQREKDKNRLIAHHSSSRVESKILSKKELLKAHTTHYCSPSEAEQGICEITENSDLSGRDVDYSAAFTSATLDPQAEVAAYAFVAKITDVQPNAEADCDSESCHNARQRQDSAMAMASMVANSFIGQVADRRIPMMTGE